MVAGRFVITTEEIMLNKGVQCMLFTNNVNVMMSYFGYLFSYHIKLNEACNFVMYLGYVNLFLHIMVFFISPMTLIHIARGVQETLKSSMFL